MKTDTYRAISKVAFVLMGVMLLFEFLFPKMYERFEDACFLISLLSFLTGITAEIIIYTRKRK